MPTPPVTPITPPKADLELCMIWPWQRSMVLQTINIVKCEPNEKCTQVPDTKIYGLNFGYELPLFLSLFDF